MTPHLNTRLQALLWQERRGHGESRFFVLPSGSEPFIGHVGHGATPPFKGWGVQSSCVSGRERG